MAKAASPVRLQQELMNAASEVGERMHRSAAEQIEYWASLGRSVAGSVNPDLLLEVSAGLAKLTVEPVLSPVVDPEAVFTALENERKSGALTDSVSSSTFRYQAASSNPGQLERISPEGQVTVGQFSNGVFTPLVEQAV
jgi:hypothetical protein